jgi:hypothetical protein
LKLLGDNFPNLIYNYRTPHPKKQPLFNIYFCFYLAAAKQIKRRQAMKSKCNPNALGLALAMQIRHKILYAGVCNRLGI